MTGASSGIGAATARRLAAEGYDVIAAARRADRLRALAAETGARAVVLDVTDEASVRSLADRIETCSLLVNNAGGAFGLAPIAAADDEDWQRMWDVNVMGTMRMTRALLPKLEASGDGVVVNLTSTAGHGVYENGGGYIAAKHAERGAVGDAAARAVRQADPGGRGRARHGRDRGVLAEPARRRPGQRRRGLRRRARTAVGRRRRRLHRLGGHPAVERQHRPAGGAADGPRPPPTRSFGRPRTSVSTA